MCLGTNEYCPPEFFDAGEYDGKQATVWQLGILLVEMLSQHIAFENPQDALTKPPNIPVYLSSGTVFYAAYLTIQCQFFGTD